MTTTPAPPLLDSTGTGLHAQVAALRNTSATKVTLPDGVTAWAITDGLIAKKLLIDKRITRNPTHWTRGRPTPEPGWLMPWTSPSMFNAHGGDHSRLRRILSKTFTKRRIESLRPAIEAIVHTRLDALAAATAAAGKFVDLRSVFSYPIPITVICDLLGVPADQRPTMAHVMEAAVNTSLPPDQAAANSHTMAQAMAALAVFKRAYPGDDLTSDLIAIHDTDDDRLSEEELLATLLLLVGAGSETTVSLINHAAVNVMTNPAVRQAVATDPEAWGDVIEETLRLNGPVMFLPLRYTTDDISFPGGITIPAGEALLIAFAAHGRDPLIHREPDAFHLDRDDKNHLAFGHGIHHCLGAPLARLEAHIALTGLLNRFPDIALAVESGQLQPLPSFISTDYTNIPVTTGQGTA
ncbi:cytochrome P450 family protein [Phytomonospora endophytica]|uniref:Cytochrome P450 n=1 Tax=Phytomonospora endophytica TaxID=714109 RepID=A0A841FSD5_9ACTN|nr:cytochrome P450 [Phytomonospora endophytica]MBB6037723.1 cytochrome P450 [Phytomonospora endophytica]GIG67749.1 cytochrome P450 [Phytomonospora endophytica]